MELQDARQHWQSRKPSSTRLAPFIEAIDRTPADATINGMYMAGLHDAIESRGIKLAKSESIRAFRFYSLREFMELTLSGALTLYPKRDIAEGLQMIGRMAIPTFASSLSGKVLMGVAGRSWELALTCVSRGYQLSLRPGHANIRNVGTRRVCVELRDVWNFGDSYQVGVVEGLMDWCNINGSVSATPRSPSNTDLMIEW